MNPRPPGYERGPGVGGCLLVLGKLRAYVSRGIDPDGSRWTESLKESPESHRLAELALGVVAAAFGASRRWSAHELQPATG